MLHDDGRRCILGDGDERGEVFSGIDASLEPGSKSDVSLVS
jgi:hypothetical protein